MKLNIKKGIISKGVIVIIISIVIFLLFNCNQSINKTGKVSKPNIMIFVADDAGWHDVEYHGSEIKTPNIDKLVKNGVELDNFYVYPTCSPTRASLLTGKYASRFGIAGPIAMKSKQSLPEKVKTLPEVLQDAGYFTAITGKWHLGLDLSKGPQKYGFDYTYGYLHGQIDQYTHRYKNGDRSWYRNGKFINEEGHATDLITNEVIKLITKKRDRSKPFFIYVPYSVPHYPLQEEDKWTRQYQNLNDYDSRKIFDASVTHMDYSIGKIIGILEKEDLLDKTLIIFFSDNGGQNNWTPTFEYDGKYGPYPKMGVNLPLRGQKHDVFEGGIRVPAVISWEGELPHKKIERLIKITDIFPTIASLINPRSLDSLNLDGKSVWDIIESKNISKEERSLYIRTKNTFAFRKGDWKLIHFGESLDRGTEELYNIKTDPYETKNVIKKNTQIRNELFKELQKQIKLDGK